MFQSAKRQYLKIQRRHFHQKTREWFNRRAQLFGYVLKLKYLDVKKSQPVGKRHVDEKMYTINKKRKL